MQQSAGLKYQTKLGDAKARVGSGGVGRVESELFSVCLGVFLGFSKDF